MRLTRTLSISLCIVISASCAIAQTADSTAATATTAPAAAPAAVKVEVESVLTHIPAGAMGFVAINNIQSSAANVERFLNDIGVAPMMDLQSVPGGLVGMLRGAAMLDSGFNPDGGFAAVMLDPQQFGVDLVKMVSPRTAMTSPEYDPNEPEQKVPFVLLVPGSSVEGVFGNYEILAGTPYSIVKLRLGEMYAVQCGSYIAVSPTAEALDAMLSAKTKVSSELTDSEKAKIATADIALHINMKVGGPICAKMLTDIEQLLPMMHNMQTDSPTVPSTDMLKMYFNIYRDMAMSLNSVTLTGKFATTGLVLNTQLLWNTETPMGKMMASFKPSGAKLLDKLPNLPYVMAFGMDYAAISDEIKAFSRDFTNKLFADKSMDKIPAEAKSKLRLVGEISNDQITGAQFVIGGPAPEGPGVFGVSYVLKCKDSAVVKDMLPELVAAYDMLFKSMMGDQAADIAFSLSYLKNAETIDGKPVDAIDISFADLENMPEHKKDDLAKVLGEGKLRLRVAAPDSKTVVISFGGGAEYLTESVKATQTEGDIKADADVLQALKHMPKNRLGLMLFNVSNLMQVLNNAGPVLGTPPMPPIATKTPITIGFGVTGNESEIALYIPNSLIKEATQIMMMFMMPREMQHGGPGPRPAPAPSEEF